MEEEHSSWGGGGGLQQGFTAPPSNLPAAKFASLGDDHVRTNAKLNSSIIPYIPTIFLYYLQFQMLYDVVLY